ncbi:ARM repeat-containing protein, partial [Aureobasidium melanogenum]
YLEAIVDMIRTIFQNDTVGGVERICGCKLAEMLMLTLRGHIDNYIPEFVMIAMTVLNNDDVKVKSYRIHLMETVINALYYNPSLALHILESNGQTNKFFSLWFSSIDIFTRVHDKKLSIAAITSLIVLPADQVPVSVQPGWPRLLQGIVRLFQTLPAAIKNREEATREDDFGLGGDYDDDEEDDEWEGEVDWTAEEIEGETDDIKDESAAYLDFLSQQASKFSSIGDDDDDDELEEESLLETPLDKVEPYGMFKHALFQLQQQQPQLYQDLTKTLSPEEQQIIQTAVNQADQIAAQQATLAQQVTEGAAPLNGGI